MRNLIKRLFARRPASTRRPAPRTRLRLEAMEVRDVPSAVASDFGRASNTDGHVIASQVATDNHDRDHVAKEVAKKNILTLKNLAPGNYTASYNLPATHGDKILHRP
jgi:hypothetical protein